MTVPVGDTQGVAPSAIIELFELQLDAQIHGAAAASTVYRFHAGTSALATNGNLVWAGQVYTAFPVEADGFEYSGTGQLPQPKLRVSNILGTITAILVSQPAGLEGSRVTRVRTLARFLDSANWDGGNPYGAPDPTAAFSPEVYYILQKTLENRDVVEFSLGAAFDLVGVRAPRRQCISNICQWEYKSAECGYTGTNYFTSADVATTLANDACGKRLNSCKLRFGSNAKLPYGSFPAVGSFRL